MRTLICHITAVVALTGLAGSPLLPRARAMDLKTAVVFSPANATTPEKKAVAMLVDEVAKRSRVIMPVTSEWPSGQTPVIAVGVGANPPGLPASTAGRLAAAPQGAEGYRVQTIDNVIVVAGNSPLAAGFGVGYLLRHLRMDFDPIAETDLLETTEDFHVATSPRQQLRGMQMAYRPKVNTYDGWTPAIFEQYVRDLLVFGANSIELMGLHSDDDEQSLNFPLAKIDMLKEMSRITHEYGLQVWLFLPTMDQTYSPSWINYSRAYNYTDPKEVDAAAHDYGELFKQVPWIDALMVPGGDPGHTDPKYLLPLMEKLAASLRESHPDAQVWMSPQQFTGTGMDEFLTYLKTSPKWLTGVAYGPGVRETVKELRAQLPANIPLRLYPDITHSGPGQYSVPNWDVALAITEAREVYNPRPVDEAKIFHYSEPYVIGQIAYSEGVNDDVNKMIWLALGWNPDADVKGVLREFCRYFLGPKLEEDGAQGLLNLELNWRGPLLTNDQVDVTFEQFRTMERQASSRNILNWRFQQMLFRAYYDRYDKVRLTYETALEQEALGKLREAGRMGSLVAMEEAQRILDRAVTEPVGADLRARVFELGEALYQSIRIQASVDRYKAVAVSRGADLDTIDLPLNNRRWLEKSFDDLRKEPGELARLAGIDKILNRTNPGPGGYYDNLGNPSKEPHLVIPLSFEQDPESFDSPASRTAALGGGPSGRQSVDGVRPDGPVAYTNSPKEWWTYAETRFSRPLSMHYTGLDPHSRYTLRFTARSAQSRVRLMANDKIEIYPYTRGKPGISETQVDLPPEATAGGELLLTWQGEPGIGGGGQGPQISEVFLIRDGATEPEVVDRTPARGQRTGPPAGTPAAH